LRLKNRRKEEEKIEGGKNWCSYFKLFILSFRMNWNIPDWVNVR
jgi:hypothetical protein